MRKFQTQVLIHEDERDMFRAFALIDRESQAEVLRKALRAQIRVMKIERARSIIKLNECSIVMDVPFGTLVRYMLDLRMEVADLYDQYGRPWQTFLLAEEALRTKRAARETKA